MPNQNGTGPRWMHGQIKCCGYRMTKPREAILDVLANTQNHLSAEDIYMAVHKFYPNIGLTTVYRNLEVLVNIGMVVKFEFGEGKSKYELSDEYSSKGHHHHLVCKECYTVIDYSDFMKDEVSFLKSTENGLSEKYKFNITDHLIQFFGVCEKCTNK
ncbi:MAG: ferric uptake regulation protein [Omnitrophica WOR_2 bacterium GWF2_38_59]|nr:MAG: ferric uptake regulation protein [Omnitrophica WOR_2 bacterium GWF2_38_59]OGX51360.1 MAG: ferric uptake regulation protein [Omnitrophica WOR_2 bacterium RIFOXYA2_FULL_38_17]OGX52229.1 MAG: ferric uptake regulation protein [Omnitrophica WOR_2 bacterium RIFOXYA12_FULL_38_10]OGX55006.1 MAG: ferric uptake regulation protein [Omnitrophica WOR_2 bacterium RIFOXYC2_FULL_38_12]OGX55187.1 MAG: ferric uptake regulation protein [Omnitrophica WOR_2 bacterium RIFOXYB2_FULL_38_16]HAB53878.1 ferric u